MSFAIEGRMEKSVRSFQFQLVKSSMDFEEQKRILEQKRAGFAVLRKLEIEQMRNATFADRLDAFRRIMGFVEHLDRPNNRADDDLLAERWSEIRRQYDARS